ncbi:phycobilisome protein [Nostocaceae cyanobacterium CENA369]|uniref:Phycobilisome protein n=1 Tax=Dendronalium phyllosphericum CENA369 TaxID=1725256 RepID=A0A8J7IAQ3_9NOST|nr:phycobilisome protein [Dendronalium phyllosphericum]MBH8577188.1 phycobilisome protein [Dendronalium phyllosphericum CENA369]
MTSQLSEKVLELIKKARIVSFTTWQDTHPAEAIQRFQAADDQGRYLTDEDFQQLQRLVPATAELIPVAQMLRDRVSDIVNEARNEVLTTFPSITQPGGGLYPPERAEACWRDFWHFLRCITYGIAGGRVDYTSTEGLHYMQLLYQELHVPLDAMVLGLEEIKAASLKRVEPQQQSVLAPYFDRLIGQLQKFEQ